MYIKIRWHIHLVLSPIAFFSVQPETVHDSSCFCDLLWSFWARISFSALKFYHVLIRKKKRKKIIVILIEYLNLITHKGENKSGNFWAPTFDTHQFSSLNHDWTEGFSTTRNWGFSFVCSMVTKQQELEFSFTHIGVPSETEIEIVSTEKSSKLFRLLTV